MSVKITESRNPATMEIDRLKTAEILELINQEDRKVVEAIAVEINNITAAVNEIYQRMKKGGRLFYAGAGTSGRLGVLDAVECVPTFSVDKDRVVGIIAGGREAMFVAQEEIEDDVASGRKQIKKYQLNERDSIVGIAASGNTPYVLGAIEEATIAGALTISLVCNYDTVMERETEITIRPVVGPEVITGSTRMKAGTAQKIVLNMISTTVMIKLGKVYSNLMVDLKPTNQKLIERAQQIFSRITGSEREVAVDYLQKSDYSVKEAIIMYEKDCNLETARKYLKDNDGILRKIIG